MTPEGNNSSEIDSYSRSRAMLACFAGEALVLAAGVTYATAEYGTGAGITATVASTCILTASGIAINRINQRNLEQN